MSLKNGMKAYQNTGQMGIHATLTDTTPDEFPSSAAFDLINQSLASDDAERKAAIKQAGAIFAFTLKNAQNKVDSWHIDLKDKGVVGKGLAPEGAKPNSMFL